MACSFRQMGEKSQMLPIFCRVFTSTFFIKALSIIGRSRGKSKGESGENSRDKKHKEIMEYDEADFQHDEDNDGYADEYPEVIDITAWA